MRYLQYTNYQSGESGLSNGIMSIEVGVVLAFLTNRFLLLEGNRWPPANIVSYGNRVDNSAPSRVSDLIDIPVPWGDAAETDTSHLASRELSEEHLGASVFYIPGTVDPTSDDAQSFASGRTNWISASGALEDVPVLTASEDHRADSPRHNLTYYSYFFYLDDETRRSVYRLLDRMQAKRPFSDFARKIAGDIGPFNAVHLRRGDFKVTYGVTTLDRQPWEAIEALDHHFNRQDTLLIVTDERDDPFFDEIKAAYPQHIFIDHHILDEYGSEFARLPQHDSIALAYLSQLIAAESDDFIGSMTSTFTAIIQRYRGNRGKHEPFKFLWNELPDAGDRLERGRHPVSECVPLERGIMIEESSGPYSWNRYSSRLAANWMREWPESFLTPGVLETGRLATQPNVIAPRQAPVLAPGKTKIEVAFDGLSIDLLCRVPRFKTRLGEAFGVRADDNSATNVIAELEISEQDGAFLVARNGETIAGADTFDTLARCIKHEVARILVFARNKHTWLEGFSFLRSGRAMVLVGDLGPERDWLPDAMCSSGWELLWDDVIPIHGDERTVTPFGRSTWPRGAALRVDRTPYPLAGLLIVHRHIHRRDHLGVLSPSVAVAELIARCIDFRLDRARAVQRLCQLVEKQGVGLLSYSSAEQAARAITEPFVIAEQESERRRAVEVKAETREDPAPQDEPVSDAEPTPTNEEKSESAPVKNRTGRAKKARATPKTKPRASSKSKPRGTAKSKPRPTAKSKPRATAKSKPQPARKRSA